VANKQASKGPIRWEHGRRWLFFWTYIRLPLGILIGFVDAAGLVVQSSIRPIEGIMILINAALLFLVLWGLARGRKWGWLLNWFIIASDVSLKPIEHCYTNPLLREEECATCVFFLVSFAILFWGIPNALYFWKRRHLFDHKRL